MSLHAPLRQPDDPGTHGEPACGPVHFVTQPFGREVAMIGDNPVGSVEPINWGRMTRASYSCSLFQAPLTFQCDTIIKAKIKLLHRIADWHDLAGPLYREHARRIRWQTEEFTP